MLKKTAYIWLAIIIFVFSLEPTLVNLELPKASAAPGDGHMLLFWDGGAAPSGWTCVSCSPGDDFYQRFIRGEETYGATGGSDTHSHTASGSVDPAVDPMPARSNAGTEINNNDHGHTFSPSISPASNLPSFRQLNVIRYDTNNDPPTLPAGAIAFFDSTVPTGWTQYSAQDGYFIRAESTVGTTGGSNTHTHAITGTLSSPSGGDRRRATASTQDDVSDNAHTHDGSGTSVAANNEPPYIEVILGQLDSDSAPVNEMYAMWDDDPSSQWLVKSAVGGPMYQNFIKASSAYGSTGGASSHSHGDASYSSGLPSTTTTSRTGGTPNASDDAHTHTVHVTGFSTDSHLPPYVDVIIAKLQPPSELNQVTYRWFGSQDSTDVGSPLAAQNVAASAPKQGKPFRLRFNLHVTVADRSINGAGLKLQYSTRSGSCDTSFIGESYSDVDTSSGGIRYYDNPTPSDADTLTTNANDPAHGSDTIRAQSYQEANNFTNNVSSIAIDEDGLWDVSLVDFSAAASTSFCFRVVRATDVLLESYTVIPEITTDDGLGHMLLFWDGGATPTGWTCVSCNPGQDFYQRFIRGEASYGGTGGSDTHTHTADGNSDTDSESGRGAAGSGIIRGHSHTSTPSIANASNLPVYRQLRVIRADASGTPGLIPTGAIAIFDASVPGGWTRYSTQDGNYIRGEDTVGSTGGSNNHVHSISGVTDPGLGVGRAVNPNPTQGPVATDTHSHTYSGNSDAQSNEPPYINTILGKINSAASVPTDMLAMWDGSIPGAWTIESGSGDPFFQRFMKPAATYGGTGGSATHSHGTSVFVTSGPDATINSRQGGTNVSSDTHTHNMTIDNFSTDNNLPPYIEVVIAKITGSNTSPNNPVNIDQIAVSTSSPIGVGGWSDETQVRFEADLSDTDNPDDLSLCVEVQILGSGFTDVETLCGSSVGYSGSAVLASVTITGLTNTAEYHWQARTKDGFGAYSSWVSFGGNAESARDFAVDDTDPSGTVFDGSSFAVDAEYNNGALDTLDSNWNISDSESGLSLFEYAIGTTIGGTDIVGWTGNGTTPNVSQGSLSLETSQVYFFTIRTTDVAGNQSIISSDGQIVAPTLTFSTSASGVVFDNLNAGNSYTDTETVTISTSTNARNGYLVRMWATGNLLSLGSDSIGMYSGGTYASPDEWLPGDTGYGYSSSDTLVQGVNKFNPVTCAGGGSGPCYAPFNLSLPGDVIADNPGVISGSPINNEQFTITHRVTAPADQQAGRYETTVILSATAEY